MAFNISFTNDGFSRIVDVSDTNIQIYNLANNELMYNDSHISIINSAGRPTTYAWSQLLNVPDSDTIKAMVGMNNDNWPYTFSMDDQNNIIFDGGVSGEHIRIPYDGTTLNAGVLSTRIITQNITYNFPYSLLTNVTDKDDFVSKVDQYTRAAKQNSVNNSKTESNTDMTNILSVQMRPDHGHHCKVSGLSLCNNSAGTGVFEVYKNATVTGQSFANLDTSDSVVAVDTAGGEVTAGDKIMSFMVAKGSHYVQDDMLGHHIVLHPSDYITIACRTDVVLATNDVHASLNFLEFL